MKPPEGFSEKVRARITEITGVDPGPFKIGSYTPGTDPTTTEAQLVEAVAQSMARMKPEDVVEDGCGCPSCDIGLEPFEARGHMWHASEKHGAWPCTKSP